MGVTQMIRIATRLEMFFASRTHIHRWARRDEGFRSEERGWQVSRGPLKAGYLKRVRCSLPPCPLDRKKRTRAPRATTLLPPNAKLGHQKSLRCQQSLHSSKLSKLAKVSSQHRHSHGHHINHGFQESPTRKGRQGHPFLTSQVNG